LGKSAGVFGPLHRSRPLSGETVGLWKRGASH
jgi:hypothetical protein